MNKNNFKSGLLALALGGTLAGAAQAQTSQVYLNGKPLPVSVSPVNQNGRLLVPLRDIFEGLGAQVVYSDLTQTIAAQRGTTTVKMALGSRLAMVNNQKVTLDVPARAYDGRTMVPLRFVSEAMGATVNYNPSTFLVSINSAGGPAGGGTQVGGVRQISIPAEAVIPVTFDEEISSENSYVGQVFTTSIQSSQPGDSEFPAGTKLQGVITEVTRKNGDNPGVLDVRFRTALLPDGTRVPMAGQLLALDSNNVVNTDGRIIAKNEKKSNDTLKIVGIGAVAGFALGKVLKKDGALPTVLGALGGLLYDKTQNKNRATEARVPAGTRLGVRLRNSVTYTDTSGYATQRGNFVRL